MRNGLKSFLNTTALLLTIMASQNALAAGSITDVGNIGGQDTSARSLSENGLVASGTSGFAPTGRGYYWTAAGGIIDIGDLGAGTFTFSLDLSGDGTTVVGYSQNASFELEAYYWTQAGGMVGIGDLGGGFSQANAVNSDGTVIVGESDNGSDYEAFRWTSGTGMVGLGTLGGADSFAQGVSGDGSIVVGASINSVGDYEAFRWDSGTGMVGLGTLGGATSSAFTISDDGTTIIGQADIASGDTEAFRWTQGTGMVGLGFNGGTFSYANAVNSNGSVIYASSDNGLFRWTDADGSVPLTTIIAASGIDLTGWDISEIYDTNSDGTIVAGGGDYNGFQSGFIMSLVPGGNSGIITPDELQESLLPTISPSQQSYSLVSDGIGQSLLVARNALNVYFPPSTMAPAAGDDIFNPYGRKRTAFYTTGNVGFGQNNNMDNSSINGTTGLLVEMNNKFVIGGGLLMGHSTEETHLDGESKVDATGIALNGTYESDAGLRVYGTVAASKLDVDSKRNYLNGATLDSSSGKTDGYAYGTSVRVGYELPHAKNDIALMPYTELQYSRSQLDAYTETGGAFAATVDKQTGKSFVSLLGLEASKAISPALTLRGRSAWGHRYTDDNGVNVTAASITQTITNDGGDKNWAELGMTVNYKITDKTTITADVQGRTSRTSDPQINVGMGLVWNFN